MIQKYSLKQLLFVYRHSRNVFERYFLLNVIYLNNNLIFVHVPKNPTFDGKKLSECWLRRNNHSD